MQKINNTSNTQVNVIYSLLGGDYTLKGTIILLLHTGDWWGLPFNHFFKRQNTVLTNNRKVLHLSNRSTIQTAKITAAVGLLF